MIYGEDFLMRLGLPGCTKTLNQTEQDILPALISGVDVWVDYWINWDLPNLHFFQEFEEIQDVRNCLVVFDEIGHILEPRNWDSENSAVRRFFQLHRHRHVDISGNTQHVSLIAKTALIEVKRFLVCTKSFDSDFWLTWFPWIVSHQQELTLKEVKQEETAMAVKKIYEDEFDFQTKIFTSWYRKKKLLHLELNDFKKEFIHHYCPACLQRQAPDIPCIDSEAYADFNSKTKLWTPKENRQYFNCPKHKSTELIIRNSSMYDTDYEMPVIEKDVVFKPFYKVLKESPFKGQLSLSQSEAKRRLEAER